MGYATILNRDDDGDGNTHNHNHNHNHNNHNLSPKPEHNHHHAPFATSAATPSSSSASSYPNLYPPPAAASTASTLPMPQHHQSPEYPPHPSPRDKPTTATTTTTTSYYDPTTDSSERRPSQSDNNPPAWHEAQQSVTTPQPREPYAYPAAASTEQAPPQQQQQPPAPYYNGTYTSPGAANSFPPRSTVSHAHPPPPRRPSISQSPRVATMPSPALHNGAAMSAPIVKQEQPAAVPAPAPAPVATPNRPADPMSFSSILSNADPSPKASPTPSAKPRKASAKSLPPPPVTDPLSRESSRQPSPVPVAPVAVSRVPTKRKSNGEAKAKASPKPKVISKEQETEVQALLAMLETEADEIDMADYENDKQVYEAAKLKRKLDMEMGEVVRNKRRRTRYAEIQARKLGHHAGLGMQRYRYIHADEAITAVQQREIEAEKIRKKDMQRKRRREKTIQQHKEHADAALLKAQESTDIVERERLFKEANKAQKKIQQTKMIIAEGDKGPSMRAMSPLEHNFSGGMISTFNVVDPEPKIKGKRGGPGSRPRKSKEQKQAEKDSAEAAQAAIDAGEEIPQFTLTPIIKEEPRLRIKLNNREHRDSRDSSPAFVPPANFEPYVSKGYNQIYDQIWRDLARKDVSKVYKLAVDMREVRGTNLKKTAVLASKEAKRWQLRTNKGTKDLQARAKRVMREMMSYWKHNERVDRDTRRAAEKQEIENMKRAEADREANRQKRKLDFLISQTELYSHFIGDKIKTSEVERSTDNPDVASADAGADGTSNVKTLGAIAPGKVTDLKDIDFDAEDDSTLQAAAAANAQAAIAEAQAKARAFNGPSGGPDMDEEGEMNFQNPSGMGSVEIEQPTMLQAQLKEYQLKGLNWLVNLYDNGINGILADEMGLGKTIQSISVMAYLAEKFGIWGPFLVVAPASTLHNWQQEITKFVPRLKVLPYWGTAADRKVLRKFWDRRHVTYTEDADFHVLVTSYQLVVSDVAYFQKMTWQYMILDEAQAIKSSQSSRWKSLLGFHCRNRLLLTGTPIQNNMQELWALLHFIMPSLFDSHDEFSEWFSKDIESHAQSNTKLNQEQLTRLHLILKPFMLRRVKKHVQKELGDKIEIDLFCDLTYRQRAYYANLRNQISIIDLIEKATLGDDNDTGTLMNLVMQFRKVCNHPDLFERAETSSPFSFGSFAQTGSFMREGNQVNVKYSTKNMIEYPLPKLVWQEGGRLDVPGQDNQKAGFKGKYLDNLMNIWRPENIHEHVKDNESFSFLRFSDTSIGELSAASHKDVFGRAVDLSQRKQRRLGELNIVYDEEDDKNFTPAQAMFRIVDRQDRKPLAEVTKEGHLNELFNVAKDVWSESGIGRLEQCSRPAASAPPIEVFCHSQSSVIEKENILFNIPMRRALYGPSPVEEQAFVTSKVSPSFYPPTKLLPTPSSEKQRFTNIQVPSMRRFVTDSGKLAKLDDLLFKLKEGGHRVLLYFQMTRMIDLMEEYLTYRNYKYCRLDGSTKLEDRRDTVHDFQTRPEIFIFLLSTRAGGLGINLTSADTVIFYDSDWNPTIDSQAMDRSHRLGQTRQVTVYRMITRGTIEERIRKRALQKEEVQKVVMTGQGGAGVDFNTRSKENRTKDIAMWLVDDDEAALIERKEQEMAAMEATQPERIKKKPGRKKKVEASGSLEDLYHEGEGHFDDGSNKPSGTATPTTDPGAKPKRGRKPGSGKKAKTAKQRFAMADGDVDMTG